MIVRIGIVRGEPGVILQFVGEALEEVVLMHLPEGVGEVAEEAPEGPGGFGVAAEAGQEGEEAGDHGNSLKAGRGCIRGDQTAKATVSILPGTLVVKGHLRSGKTASFKRRKGLVCQAPGRGDGSPPHRAIPGRRGPPTSASVSPGCLEEVGVEDEFRPDGFFLPGISLAEEEHAGVDEGAAVAAAGGGEEVEGSRQRAVGGGQ